MQSFSTFGAVTSIPSFTSAKSRASSRSLAAATALSLTLSVVLSQAASAGGCFSKQCCTNAIEGVRDAATVAGTVAQIGGAIAGAAGNEEVANALNEAGRIATTASLLIHNVGNISKQLDALIEEAATRENMHNAGQLFKNFMNRLVAPDSQLHRLISQPLAADSVAYLSDVITSMVRKLGRSDQSIEKRLLGSARKLEKILGALNNVPTAFLSDVDRFIKDLERLINPKENSWVALDIAEEGASTSRQSAPAPQGGSSSRSPLGLSPEDMDGLNFDEAPPEEIRVRSISFSNPLATQMGGTSVQPAALEGTAENASEGTPHHTQAPSLGNEQSAASSSDTAPATTPTTLQETPSSSETDQL